MSTESENTVSVIVTDSDIASLHLGLKLLNNSIDKLSKANMLNKSSAAETVVGDVRDLLAKLVFNQHSLFNENLRMKAELNRIGNIGVIKNG